jgi:hypothetical protein
MSTSPHNAPQQDYTDRDIRLQPIVKYALGIALFTAASFAAVAYLQAYWEKQAAVADARAVPMSTERRLPPTQLLQVAEVKDLAAHRAYESNLTTNYAVVDQAAGIYRIPVERAIELLAARGLPARSSSNP